MLTRAQLQQFFTSIGMILVFIGVKKSPLDAFTSWWWWIIVGVMLFVFAPSISRKINGEA